MVCSCMYSVLPASLILFTIINYDSLTHLRRVDSCTTALWTHLFPIAGRPVSFYYYYVLLKVLLLMQTV